MKVRDFSKIFFSILILQLAVIYRPESEILYLISKPLLMFSLLAFFIHRTAKIQDTSKNWIIAALLISMCGDIIFLKEGEIGVLIGMGALLIANIFYIIFYFRQPAEAHPAMVLLAAALAGGIVLGAIMWVDIPQILPYYFYGFLVITGIQFIKSVHFCGSRGKTVWPINLGALLYLAFAVIFIFYRPEEGNKYWHMAAVLIYGLAQYGITIGILNYLREGKK